LLLLFVLLVQLANTGEPAPDLTEAEHAWLRANATRIELWYNPDFPPLEFASESGEFVGMGADVLALIEERLGVSFRKRVCKDWSRHLQALDEGLCAIAPTIVQTAERERFALFTSPYAKVPVVIIGTARLGQHLSLDDLAGYRVAIVAGFASEGHVRRQNKGRYQVVTVSGVEEGVRAVAFGQVDAYVENLAVASHYIARNGITNLKVAGKADYDFVFRLAISHKYPELHGIIQKALDDIPPAELQVVRDRWISLQPQQGLSPRMRHLLVMAGAFLSLLVIGLAVITTILRRSLNEKVASLRTAHEEVARNEARFRALFLHAPLPLIEITLEYTVRTTNSRYNYVYPFYKNEGTNISS
jgi:ABC-type amino acid transport substrate-binding protein